MSSSNHSTEALVVNEVPNETAPLVPAQTEDAGCTPAKVLMTGACATASIVACAGVGAGVGYGSAKFFGLMPLSSTNTSACVTGGSIIGALCGGTGFYIAANAKPTAVQSTEQLQAHKITSTMVRN